MIVLIRHGQTHCSDGRCVGRTEVPLSEEGRAQARKLAATLGNIGFRRLCTSPSERAVDTLAPLAARLGMESEVVPELAEIDMGQWDGLLFEVIRRKYPEEYELRGRNMAGYAAPGGETFQEVADRAMAVLEDLAKGEMPVCVATHAGVIRTVLCRVTGRPLDDLFSFKPGHARCTLLRRETEGFRLVAENLPSQDVGEYF